MDLKESIIYQKWCWENNITIYPKPVVYNGSKCKIVINTNGIENVRNEVYEDKASFRLIEVEVSPGKVKQVKQLIPALYDEIRRLYKETYFLNKDKVL